MREKMTEGEIVKAFDDFRDAVMYIQKNKKVFEDTVRECDQAFCDIRHYCELSYPTNKSKRTKICQLMRDYSIKRRNAKDMLQVISHADGMQERKPLFLTDIYRIANEMKKEKDKVESERFYRPRVLTELWGEKSREKTGGVIGE